MTATAVMAPIHPGEVLLAEYLEPLGITQHRLAVAIAAPPRRRAALTRSSTASAASARTPLASA